jgi:hypothetical protein
MAFAVLLVFILGCLFASTRFAIHAEHQLRRGQPIAQAWELTAATAVPTSAGPAATRRGTRHLTRQPSAHTHIVCRRCA